MRLARVAPEAPLPWPREVSRASRDARFAEGTQELVARVPTGGAPAPAGAHVAIIDDEKELPFSGNGRITYSKAESIAHSENKVKRIFYYRIESPHFKSFESCGNIYYVGGE